jgi:hypothetical protein
MVTNLPFKISMSSSPPQAQHLSSCIYTPCKTHSRRSSWTRGIPVRSESYQYETPPTLANLGEYLISANNYAYQSREACGYCLR